MDAERIAYFDGVARKHYSFLADPVNDDNWRSHADEALAGKPWRGDCDDLASTALDLLGRNGMPLESRYRMLVASGGSDKANHMVGCAVSEDGQYLVVGDTFGACYPSNEMGHNGIYYNRLSETLPTVTWRAGVPWL